jgi:hypothetical protein
LPISATTLDAARHIEKAEVAVAFRRVDCINQRVLPGPVQAGRHQVVHQVIAARDRVENIVHQTLFFLDRHSPEAKIRFVCRVVAHKPFLRGGR